jgi:hypothetical protein
MLLSPDAPPFFSCTHPSTLRKRDVFLCNALSSLSHFDFTLLSVIIAEWESSPFLDDCLRIWKSHKSHDLSPTNSLHVLSFNVRGFNLRYQEVMLLADSFNLDVLILLETGLHDAQLYSQAFSAYKAFSQAGENSNGGTVILVKDTLKANRIPCDLPNVCVVDILAEKSIYAPESKSWSWDDLSTLVNSNCAFFGDFNVDMTNDTVKADALLRWADTTNLTPYAPKLPTSLRSDRIIDYVLTSGFSICIQTYEGGTTSDHKPILSIVPTQSNGSALARNIHWKVLSSFCEYVFPFWERRWQSNDLNVVYNDYTTFLSLLTIRCTVLFPLNQYRISIPPELRASMSLTRALSFRQKRTGDILLKALVKTRRKEAKYELKRFLEQQLAKSLAMRNTASPL